VAKTTKTLLTVNTELLFRQATSPAWLSGGKPAEAAFLPRQLDNGELSMSREQVIKSAKAALEHFRSLYPKVGSAGVLAVSVGEVSIVNLNSYASPSRNIPAHAHIDMSKKTQDEIENNIAPRLAEQAWGRGVLAR